MPGDSLVGAKWPATPITYSIATSNAASSPGQPFSSFIPPSDPLGVASDVADDFRVWSYLTGLQFQQVPDSATPGSVPDIRVGFGTLSGGALSATAYASSGGIFLLGTQILLQDPSVTPLLATYQGSTAGPLQLVFAEIGHAVGIAASSDLTSALNPANAGPSSTNYFYQNRYLSPSDVAAVESLYGTVLPSSITQAVLRHDVVTVGPSVDRYGNRIPGDDATAHGIPGGTVTLPSAYLGTVLVSLTPGGSMQLQVNQPGGATASVDGSRVASIEPGDALTDPTGNAEQVARLFQAVLDRQSDLGSLYMYANDVDQGTLSLAQVGTILASSPEFLQRYPAAAGTSASAQAVFVDALYENLFGRPAARPTAAAPATSRPSRVARARASSPSTSPAASRPEPTTSASRATAAMERSTGSTRLRSGARLILPGKALTSRPSTRAHRRAPSLRPCSAARSSRPRPARTATLLSSRRSTRTCWAARRTRAASPVTPPRSPRAVSGAPRSSPTSATAARRGRTRRSPRMTAGCSRPDILTL